MEQELIYEQKLINYEEQIKTQPTKKEIKTLKQCVAPRVIELNGFKVYQGKEVNAKKQILKRASPLSIKPIKTIINLNVNYALPYLPKEIQSTTSYNYLKKLGWKISVKETKGEVFSKQRVSYFLTKLNSNNPDYKKVPDNHHIDVDLVNQVIRLVGKNIPPLGFSEWYPINQKIQREQSEKNINPFNIQGLHKNIQNGYVNNLPDQLKAKQKEIKKEIEEALIGITEFGEFVCIPKTTPKTKDSLIGDAPVIAISGTRGFGKSLLENNLEGQFYYKYGWDILNFNDVKGDTRTRCLTWDEESRFYKDLKNFGEDTVPLPYIYLSPTIKGLTEEEIFYEGLLGYKVSLDFKELMVDSDLIKYNKEWKLSDKAPKWIKDSIEDEKGEERTDGLMTINNLEDLKNVLDKYVPKKTASGLNDAIYKVVKDIWNSNILDKTSGVSSKWTVIKDNKKRTDYPWNICLITRTIASLNTSRIREEPYFAVWIKHVLGDVFNFVRNSRYNRYLMLCGDELVDILRDKDLRGIVDKTIREGRTDKVGVMEVVQFRKDIPDSIITNTSHNFIFKTNSKTDLDLIKKEFPDLSKEQIYDITNLKKFQCYAIGDFILYNMNGDRYSNNGEPIKIIKIKPPNALHWGGK